MYYTCGDVAAQAMADYLDNDKVGVAPPAVAGPPSEGWLPFSAAGPGPTLTSSFKKKRKNRKRRTGGDDSRRRCFNCGNSGHLSADCVMPAGNTACYVCGMEGHKSKECPSAM